MSNVVNLPPPSVGSGGVEFHGPFYGDNFYYLTVDGFQVPNLHARREPNGEWCLVLDRRLAVVLTEDEARKTAWFMANCMAFGAGYSCFGENCQPMNPYHVRVGRLG